MVTGPIDLAPPPGEVRYFAQKQIPAALGTIFVVPKPFATEPAGSGTYPWPTWVAGNKTTVPEGTGTKFYVSKAGSDANDGLSYANAKLTIAAAVALITTVGQSVLIGAGTYKEKIPMGSRSGSAGQPVTVGAYGNGEVIVDASPARTTWTQVSGNVWTTTLSYVPACVVVGDVPLKQVKQGQHGSGATGEDATNVTDGSGKWYVNYATNAVTADFGSTIASDPNSADVFIPKYPDGGTVVEDSCFSGYHVSYITIDGLTLRGSENAATYFYGHHIKVTNCDAKFCCKQGVTFNSDDNTYNNNNQVLYTRVMFNMITNWPRGNNFWAESAGGWGGGLGFQYQNNCLARGNIVCWNGGEGLITYGSASGRTTGSNIIEQNVIYENWSVNSYVDNQPNCIVRQNFVFNHQFDPTTCISTTGFPFNTLQKYTVGIMLANEQNSGFAPNYAALAGTQVYNNIIAGCRCGIRDYAEGATATANHGLIDTLIAFNTIIMPYDDRSSATSVAGFFLGVDQPQNSNSQIINNVVYGYNAANYIFNDQKESGWSTGLTVDGNIYYHATTNPFSTNYAAPVARTFAAWKSTTSLDANSTFSDPLITDLAEFYSTNPIYDWRKAAVAVGSPARSGGVAESTITSDFAGAARSSRVCGALM